MAIAQAFLEPVAAPNQVLGVFIGLYRPLLDPVERAGLRFRGAGGKQCDQHQTGDRPCGGVPDEQ
ncbi:hypothetical protein [Thioflavicoccus mobilis]|uniref:hypothetical protein n=1 Tax=Thioflavicoccus mobilis TaxID=80679 RepID=UPI0012F776A5|nr:hypothetical protein [Thioflavicoccus mobilis]